MEVPGRDKKTGGKQPKQEKETTIHKPTKGGGGPGEKSIVEKKRIYPYADGSFSIGTPAMR